MINQKKYSQFFTPVWAAEFLFNRHFNHLTDKDLVWEPSCGVGSFLSAIPFHIQAIGSDIDPELVEVAHQNTDRPVYCGDFRHVIFPDIQKVTAIVGNPPFKLDVFEQFMQRCESILPLGHKAGFIIPAYFFQTSGTFMRFAKKWDIDQEILPRDIFPSLSMPIIWASFVRDNFPKLVGFALHKEVCDVNALSDNIKDILTIGVKRSGSVWKEALINIVNEAGGTITLNQVYEKMEGKRPTENPFWKQQIRKLIQQAPFEKINRGFYKLTV